MKNSRLSQTGSKPSIGLPGLESLRQKDGVTQENLAREMGITVGHLWKIARGHRNASTDLIEKLCERLGCSPNDLLGWKVGKAV